jgi:hypothetical protein
MPTLTHSDPKAAPFGYTFPVTPKKGVIRCGSLSNPLRRKPQSLPQRVCGLFVRASSFWRLGQGAARLAGSRKRVPGLPHLPELPPHVEVGVAVFANRTHLEANHA